MPDDPGLYGDDVAVLEATHVELAGGGTTLCLAVGRTVDIQRAHAADTLAAVVVEDERLLASLDELFVHDVEGFEEGGIVRYVLQFVGIEMALCLRAVLLPELDGNRNILCHNIIGFKVLRFQVLR